MFSFLQTLGLLATAGILLPVVIHLWNKREGKTIKIGSVQLLVETARQQARSLRLRDLLLLLLRCLIIFLVAALLAKPVWRQRLFTNNKKGWVVLDVQTKEAYQHYKPLVDSLRLAGFETHRLNYGFPAVNLEDSTTGLKESTGTLPYWALLKALNEQVPDDLPIFLITNTRLNRFKGNRPAVAMNLRWLTYTNVDTVTDNPIAIRLLNTDSIETITAHSTTTSTAYLSTKSAKDLHAQIHQSSVVAAALETSLQTDTSTLRIAILKDPSGTDAGYLGAALQAIRQFGKYRMQVETISDPGNLVAAYDWVFWLSPKVPPATLKTRHLLVYEYAKEKMEYSWMKTSGLNRNDEHKIRVIKGLKNKKSGVDEIIWKNGYGEPLLTLKTSKVNVFHFYNRFNPAWSDLVWSEDFPQMLFDVMLKAELENPLDNRVLETQQMKPEINITPNAAVKPRFMETTDLSRWFWLAAFLLFLLERLFSFYPKKKAYA